MSIHHPKTCVEKHIFDNTFSKDVLINACEKDLMDAFAISCFYGKTEAALILFENGFSTREGLKYAFEQRRESLLESMIHIPTFVKQYASFLLFQILNRPECSFFQSLLLTLLDMEIPVTLEKEEGIFHLVVCKNHIQTLRLLLIHHHTSHLFDTPPSSQRLTPFEWAILLGHVECAKILFEKGADTTRIVCFPSYEKRISYFLTYNRMQLPVVKDMISSPDEFIMWSLTLRNLKMVDYLLDLGAWPFSWERSFLFFDHIDDKVDEEELNSLKLKAARLFPLCSSFPSRIIWPYTHIEPPNMELAAIVLSGQSFFSGVRKPVKIRFAHQAEVGENLIQKKELRLKMIQSMQNPFEKHILAQRLGLTRECDCKIGETLYFLSIKAIVEWGWLDVRKNKKLFQILPKNITDDLQFLLKNATFRASLHFLRNEDFWKLL